MSDTVTFRSVTPIFRFEMEDGQEFHHAGELNNATFQITVKKFLPGPDGFSELTEYADENQKKALTSIHMSPEPLFPPADYFVVVDVTHSPQAGLETHGNTRESVVVNQAILDSLRFNSSLGIDRFNTYHWKEPHNLGAGTSLSLFRPTLFSPLGKGPSILLASVFEECRTVADNLLKGWDDTVGFDRVLQMAMSYHEVTSTFREPKHGFLLLMIIFEALFKDQSEKTPIAVKRLSKLLASSKTESKLITKLFSQGESSYTKIRDAIAHGDVSLDSADVKKAYPDLYKYVTSSITQLLLVENGVFNPKKDYYREMDRISKERFKEALGKPSSVGVVTSITAI